VGINGGVKREVLAGESGCGWLREPETG